MTHSYLTRPREHMGQSTQLLNLKVYIGTEKSVDRSTRNSSQFVADVELISKIISKEDEFDSTNPETEKTVILSSYDTFAGRALVKKEDYFAIQEKYFPNGKPSPYAPPAGLEDLEFNEVSSILH